MTYGASSSGATVVLARTHLPIERTTSTIRGYSVYYGVWCMYTCIQYTVLLLCCCCSCKGYVRSWRTQIEETISPPLKLPSTEPERTKIHMRGAIIEVVDISSTYARGDALFVNTTEPLWYYYLWSGQHLLVGSCRSFGGMAVRTDRQRVPDDSFLWDVNNILLGK